MVSRFVVVSETPAEDALGVVIFVANIEAMFEFNLLRCGRYIPPDYQMR